MKLSLKLLVTGVTTSRETIQAFPTFLFPVDSCPLWLIDSLARTRIRSHTNKHFRISLFQISHCHWCFCLFFIFLFSFIFCQLNTRWSHLGRGISIETNTSIGLPEGKSVGHCFDGYGRAQSIRGDTTFVQVALGCVRKQAEQTNKRSSLVVSASVPVSSFLL